MEFAQCTQNNSLYNAQQFSELNAADLDNKRRYLVCHSCGGRAFFRAETRNDREACFGARPHADDCQLRAGQAMANDHDARNNDGFIESSKRLVVDFGYGAQPMSQSSLPGEVQNMNTPNERLSGSGFSTHQEKHVRLRPLLRHLTETPFSTSLQIVDVTGFGTFRVADFFIPFHTITLAHDRKYVGIFGNIAYAQFDPQAKTLWLNSGNPANPSIGVPWAHIPELFNRFQINDAIALAKANVLVFGAVRTSVQGKQYVILEDLRHITVDLARGQL